MLRRLFVVVMSMTLGLMAGLVLTGRMRTAITGGTCMTRLQPWRLR